MGSSTPTIVPFSASISLQKQNQQMWVYVAIGHLDFLVPKSSQILVLTNILTKH